METWEQSTTYKAVKLLQSGIAKSVAEAYEMAERGIKEVQQ
jgi:hypothetical protein